MGRHLATTGMFPRPTWRLGDWPVQPASVQQDLDTEWHFKRVVQVWGLGRGALQALMGRVPFGIGVRVGVRVKPSLEFNPHTRNHAHMSELAKQVALAAGSGHGVALQVGVGSVGQAMMRALPLLCHCPM